MEKYVNKLAYFEKYTYLHIAKVYQGSPVAPICTTKKMKSCPICLQLGHVLFMGIFYNDGSVPIEKY